MIWLLLAAQIANAQSTGTISTPVEDSIKASNMGKAIRDLESGRYRQTGKPTFAGGICFADGTCQTTASVSVVRASSCTEVNAGTFTNTALGVAVASVTITLNGGTQQVIWSGGTYGFTSDQDILASYIIGDQWPANITISPVSTNTALGVCSVHSSNSPACQTAFNDTLQLSAGSYTFGLTVAVDNGTGGIGRGTAIPNGSASLKLTNRFCVVETK